MQIVGFAFFAPLLYRGYSGSIAVRERRAPRARQKPRSVGDRDDGGGFSLRLVSAATPTDAAVQYDRGAVCDRSHERDGKPLALTDRSRGKTSASC